MQDLIIACFLYCKIPCVTDWSRLRRFPGRVGLRLRLHKADNVMKTLGEIGEEAGAKANPKAAGPSAAAAERRAGDREQLGVEFAKTLPRRCKPSKTTHPMPRRNNRRMPRASWQRWPVTRHAAIWNWRRAGKRSL